MPSPENIAFASDPQNGKIGGIALADLPSLVAERMSRSYASWLAWWKGTINSDDYMKYLATQVGVKNLRINMLHKPEIKLLSQG